MLNVLARSRHAITLVTCLSVVACANAAETDPDGDLYSPSADALLDVQQALDRSEEGNRLALVVLGANWCHDSRALAARLQSAPLSEVIQQHYELVFVDVGFLDKGRSVAERFGVAHYYATPTVLIVNPANGQLINDEDRHQWGNAYNIDMPTSVAYFEKWSGDGAVAEAVAEPAELTTLLLEIDAFEQQLADRVATGYTVVGPMLELLKAGDKPEAFDASWNELRDFRVAIPKDIRALRDEARRRVLAGEQGVEIERPKYPLLSWE